MTVRVDADISRGTFTLSIDASFESGTVTAILGPNGAGKSTLIRAIAGLQALDRGTITIDDRVVDDSASILVPPRERACGVVFQDYALFPHLSVLDNVAFGPRSLGASNAQATAVAHLNLDRLGIDHLAARRPSGISGGQAQRVALARALATQPRVLLLDEPMAALDAETRMEIRIELERQLADFAGCALLVTHDPLDAMLLADRVLVIEEGRVVQVGSPAELASRPVTDYVAALMGVTLLRGTADDGVLDLDDGGRLHIADRQLAGRALAVLRPSSITLHRQPPEGSARNAWQGTVKSLQPSHDRVLVVVDGPPSVAAAVTPGAIAELGLSVGTGVWLSVKAVEVDAYPNPTR
jgi:molybdate transport system ATP-binding protein